MALFETARLIHFLIKRSKERNEFDKWTDDYKKRESKAAIETEELPKWIKELLAGCIKAAPHRKQDEELENQGATYETSTSFGTGSIPDATRVSFALSYLGWCQLENSDEWQIFQAYLGLLQKEQFRCPLLEEIKQSGNTNLFTMWQKI